MGGVASCYAREGDVLGVEVVVCYDRRALQGRQGLISVRVPDGVASIPEDAFRDCMTLVSVTFPASLRRIGAGAFRGCGMLHTTDIPETVSTMGSRAFSNCYSLRDVNLPASLTEIGDETFSRCRRLASVRMPALLERIGKLAFFGCTSLADAELPLSLSEIGMSAFAACTSLERVEIPESVVSIGDGAFARCAALRSVHVSDSVASIGDDAFLGCGGGCAVSLPGSLGQACAGAFPPGAAVTFRPLGPGAKPCPEIHGLVPAAMEAAPPRLMRRSYMDAAARGGADPLVAAGAGEVEPTKLQSLPEQDGGQQAECWALFAEGEAESELATGTTDGLVRWATDGTGAQVPAKMLLAEELMQRALLSSQCARGHEAIRGSRASRVFRHAEWLAGRNHAGAAELRFREASREAAQHRRTALAQHALTRLGYFLSRWGRPADAFAALLEAETLVDLGQEQDPAVPFLLGVVGRQSARGDARRLREAEERILGAGRQPTEELESQRQELQSEIRFWRAAELSPRRCLDADEVVHALICLGGHAFHALAR